MNNRLIAGGLAGGILSFILGYLVWGMLLSGYYTTHFNQCMALPMENMVWWSVIAFNLVMGGFIALVFSWANVTAFLDGAVKGAMMGFLISLSIDLSFYSFSTMFTGGLTTVAVDVIVNTVFWGVLGGVVGLVMGKVKA